MTAPDLTSMRPSTGVPRPRLTRRQREILVTLLRKALDDRRAELARHESSVSSEDAGDERSAVAREIALAYAERARAGVAEVEDALARIEAGTYGTCGSCGKPVPFEQLEAAPTVRECVACRRAERLAG